MKICNKCNELKSYEFFSKGKGYKDGYQYQCKSCVAEYKKKYYEENREKIDEYLKQYQQKNKERLKEYKKQYREENKDKIKEYKKQYWKENKEKLKEYRRENKEQINEYKKEWEKERMKTDFLFNMTKNLRSRTYKIFKNKGYSKNTKTQEMLGVEWEVAKIHIERQFKKGMSWSNYGEWHIDHIIPLASANTEEELINLCRYTNLQPLWAEENLSKGCKIEETQLKLI